jgi:hypothetical protein
MPIIVKGQLHDPTTPIVEATERPITVAFVYTEGSENQQETKTEKQDVNDHHHMVIRGTKKKLGIKSEYMLDLLTIE